MAGNVAALAADRVYRRAAPVLAACLATVAACSDDEPTATTEQDAGSRMIDGGKGGARADAASDAASVPRDAAVEAGASDASSAGDAGHLSTDAATDAATDAGDRDDDGGGCVARTEACFNGVDDDCDGDTDCEDDDCTPGAECVELVPDGLPGARPDVTGGCPNGHIDGPPLKQGLTASSVCSGCTYADPVAARCTSMLSNLTGCTVAAASTGIFSDQCHALGFSPVDVRIATFSQDPPCGGSGTPVPEPVSWTEELTYCENRSLGAGCAGNQACMPRLATPRCVLLEGNVSCPSEYPSASAWYTGTSDTRDCTSATCPLGTPTGGSCEGSVRIYAGNNCLGTATAEVTVGTTCGAAGGGSARIFIDSQTLPTCEPPTLGATGTAMPVGPTTLCCES